MAWPSWIFQSMCELPHIETARDMRTPWQAQQRCKGDAHAQDHVGRIAVAAAIAVVWSMVTLARSKVVNNAGVATASAPIMPHELTVRHGRDLPSEYWHHPFLSRAGQIRVDLDGWSVLAALRQDARPAELVKRIRRLVHTRPGADNKTEAAS